jgi:hypothetical protein
MGGIKIKKKRKLDEDNRAFNSKQEEVYFCAEKGGKPQCLICLKLLEFGMSAM